MARFKSHALFILLWLAVAKCEPLTSPPTLQVTSPSPDVASPPPDVASPPPEVASPSPDVASPSPDVTSPPPEVTSPSPDVTSPSPDVTSPSPDVTSPSPDVTSPSPEVTSPSPDVTSPSPDVTSPSPDVTSPSPDVTSPSPDVTSPSPEVTSPSPDVTSPSPDVTSPSPDVTSPSPDVTSPSPEVTSPSPDVTSPSPDVTSPSPEVTSPPTPEVTSPSPDVTSPSPEVTSPPTPEVTSPSPEVTSPPTPEVTSPSPEVTSPSPEVTTLSPDPCAPMPCGPGSTCRSQFQTFTCLCLAGQYYEESTKRCAEAKVFPVSMQMTVSWDDMLGDPKSFKFKVASDLITTQLNHTFHGDDGYVRSIVLAFSKSATRTALAVATVENIFSLQSAVSEANVNDKITAAIREGLLSATTTTNVGLCDQQPCDKYTASCEAANGTFSCSCLKDFVPSSFSIRVCKACESGFRAVSNTCIPCAYGRHGVNCNEPWQLVLVIVGSVFGGLLLLLLITVGVLSRRAKKSNKMESDEDATYYGSSLAKAPLINPTVATPAAAAGNGFPKIPRATPARDPFRGSHLEMSSNVGRQNTAWPSNEPAQNRATTNPYVQNRDHYGQNQAMNNPYSQKRGHINSNYEYGGERRY